MVCMPCFQVRRILLCSGKIYYELMKERQQFELDHRIAISRVEQVDIDFLFRCFHLHEYYAVFVDFAVSLRSDTGGAAAFSQRRGYLDSGGA